MADNISIFTKIKETILGWIKLAYLTSRQDALIFRPWIKNLEAIQEPSGYGLESFESVFIQTEDHVRINIWRKQADEGKPTFIVFHGNTGHFGDVSEPVAGEPFYDRRYRVATLKTIAETGAGIIAVSMRGYGNSSRVKPSQIGYVKDIKAVFEYIKSQNLSDEQIILFGESMGAAIELILLSQMNDEGFEPKMAVMVAAFSSIKNKAIDDHPQLAYVHLEKYIRHMFDNEKFFQETNSKTFFAIFHPEEDMTTKKYHSEKLFRIALDRNLHVEYQELKGAGHITWNSAEVIAKVLEKYTILTKKFN